jgi:hypothetical protein
MPVEADQGAAFDRARFLKPQFLERPLCPQQATAEV